MRFRYKLQGLDADWQNVGTRRQAYYSNLAPREYRFRVIACNNDGVWNETGASLDFSITPAYYQTTWFRVTCLAAFLVLLRALYKLRLLRIHRRSEQLLLMNAKLEAQIAERKQAEDALRRSEAYLAEGQRLAGVYSDRAFPTARPTQNPNRHKHLAGSQCVLPYIGRVLPVILPFRIAQNNWA